MNIEEVIFEDKTLPFERILKLIREGKILNAKIAFNRDMTDDICYQISCNVDEKIFLKNFALRNSD